MSKQIPEGMFVFTSDNKEVGSVSATDDLSFTVDLRDTAGSVTIPSDMADEVVSGRMALTIDSGEFRTKFLEGREDAAKTLFDNEPAPPAASDHVPEEALRLMWDEMDERSWRELHRVAHAEEDERGEDRIERAALMDIVKVAGQKDEAQEPFPATFEEFRDAVNRHAETMAHETRSAH